LRTALVVCEEAAALRTRAVGSEGLPEILCLTQVLAVLRIPDLPAVADVDLPDSEM